MFTFYVVLWCNKKLEKFAKVGNFGAVRKRGPMAKSGPLELPCLANQIQPGRFRIPDSRLQVRIAMFAIFFPVRDRGIHLTFSVI